MKSPRGCERILGGKYRMLNKILGQGGLGRVSLGENLKTGLKVAIKETLRPLKNGSLEKALSQNEPEVLKKLSGKPYILNIFDSFQEKQKVFIVTELCEGASLAHAIRKNSLNYEEFLELFRSLLKGVNEMKKEEIVHRDLKPQNVLFTAAGEIKIADFGFATTFKNLESERDLSIGSLYYKAPESLLRYEYSTKSDIWSIGIIFFQILFRKLPWIEKNSFRLFQAIMFKPIQKIIPVKLVNWIEKFLFWSLHPDPKQRADADELLALIPTEVSEFSSVFTFQSMISLKSKQERQKNVPSPKKNQKDRDLIPIENELEESLILKKSTSSPPPKEKSRLENVLQKVMPVLLQQIDFCRLKFETLKVILTIKGNSQHFKKMAEEYKIETFLWSNILEKFQKIDKVDYKGFDSWEKDEFKKSKNYAEVCAIAKSYRKQYEGLMAKFNIKRENVEEKSESICEVLRWLHCNVKRNTQYKFFVLYDYLITMKWLLDIEESQNGPFTLCEEVDIGALVQAFRREQDKNGKISDKLLSILSEKLEELNIIFHG